jgi:hypothetical protein
LNASARVERAVTAVASASRACAVCAPSGIAEYARRAQALAFAAKVRAFSTAAAAALAAGPAAAFDVVGPFLTYDLEDLDFAFGERAAAFRFAFEVAFDFIGSSPGAWGPRV